MFDWLPSLFSWITSLWSKVPDKNQEIIIDMIVKEFETQLREFYHSQKEKQEQGKGNV